MLTNPYLIAIGIPILLIIGGALAKKIVRASPFQMSDFYFGVELVLAALGSALINLYDIGKVSAEQVTSKVSSTASFAVITFLLMFVILAIHQEWEKKATNPAGQCFWLVFVCNGLGVALFGLFVMLIKGV